MKENNFIYEFYEWLKRFLELNCRDVAELHLKKNKSTINENVVCIFCIICSSVFCIFLQVKKKKRGQKEFNLFNLIVGHYYYFV